MAERSKRGFASMNKEKQRMIASKGGKAAHAKGTAHEFTREEAVAAGRKGGKAAHAKGTAHQLNRPAAGQTGEQKSSSENALSGAGGEQRTEPHRSAEFVHNGSEIRSEQCSCPEAGM